MVEEKEVMGKIMQVEEGDECPHPDPRDWQFVLLLRVTQANGRPLPMEGFISRAMVQMICDVIGGHPKRGRNSNGPRGCSGSRGSVFYSRGIQSDTGVISLGRTSSYRR